MCILLFYSYYIIYYKYQLKCSEMFHANHHKQQTQTVIFFIISKHSKNLFYFPNLFLDLKIDRKVYA